MLQSLQWWCRLSTTCSMADSGRHYCHRQDRLSTLTTYMYNYDHKIDTYHDGANVHSLHHLCICLDFVCILSPINFQKKLRLRRAKNLLFTWSKGHGSGSPQRNATLSLPCVLSNTARLLVQWQYTKPARHNGGTDTKTVPASKTKGKCAGGLITFPLEWSFFLLVPCLIVFLYGLTCLG